VEAAIVVYERQSRFIQSQLKVRKVFESTPFQLTAAVLITANFIFNIVEAQIMTGYCHSSGATRRYTHKTLHCNTHRVWGGVAST
jgi:hypothetical protein